MESHIQPSFGRNSVVHSAELARISGDTTTSDSESHKSFLTTKGLKYLIYAFVLASLTRILDTYSGNIKGKGYNGKEGYIDDTEVIVLIGIGFTAFVLLYPFQNQKLSDLNLMQLFLIGIISIGEIIASTTFLLGNWMSGATIAVLFNGVSLIFNVVFEKLFLGSSWYKCDIIAVIFGILGLFSMFLRGFLDIDANNTEDKKDSKQQMIGMTLLFISNFINAIQFTVEEKLVKMDGIKIGSKLFLSAQGIIGGTATIIICIIFSFTPGFEGYKAANGKLLCLSDILLKMWNSKHKLLLIVVLLDQIALYGWYWSGNKVTKHVNSVARQILSISRAIPIFFFCVFIGKNSEGEYLQKFKWNKWSEYLIFIAFIFFILSSLVYFQIGVPNWLKRNIPDANEKDDFDNNNGGTEVTNTEYNNQVEIV